jgi:predicted nucleic acid-binding protein
VIVVDTNLIVFAYDFVASRHAAARHWWESAGTGGNLTTDALIAAHAVEHAATVHSDDRDFGRFGGLRWHNPLA